MSILRGAVLKRKRGDLGIVVYLGEDARAEVQGQKCKGRDKRAKVEISYSYFKMGNKSINNNVIGTTFFA